MTADAFFEMKDINKYYQMGEEPVHVLKDINLTIEKGEFLSVLGTLAGKDVNKLGESQIADFTPP